MEFVLETVVEIYFSLVSQVKWGLCGRRDLRFDDGVGKTVSVRIRKLMEDIEIIRRVAVTKKM